MELDLKRRHQGQLEDLKESIENGTMNKDRIHYSSAILELQNKANQLGQSGFYKESKKLNKQVSQAKSIEQKKFNNKVRQKLIWGTKAILERQRSEKDHLKGKMLIQREHLLQVR